MDASFVEYYKIILDIAVAAIISIVLLLFARRSRRQKTFVGYRKSPKDEKYAGYILLSIGIAVMALSILELIILLTSNFYSTVPFGLTSIQISSESQTIDLISAHLLGYGFGISFWLTIFFAGGGKMLTLGMDLLLGTQLKMTKKIRDIIPKGDTVNG
jgi:ABC-type Fe3+ transport system permease subunit